MAPDAPPGARHGAHFGTGRPPSRRIVPQLDEALRAMLRDGRWAPGERLPSEARLAAELGVGRSSVREAVRLLAHDGLLDVRHGSGTYAAEAPPASPAQRDLARLLRRARLLEVHEVRRALEVEAARLAARRTRPEDVDRLTATLRARQRHVGGDPAQFIDADLDFHRTVVELSGNRLLTELFASVAPVLRAALIDMVRHEPGLPDVSCAHAALLDALARGDAEGAIDATVDHLDSTMTYLRGTETDQ
jgi:DNA-binding FadR family transcriptional regulator